MKYVKRFIQAIALLVVLIIATAYVAMTLYKKDLAGILVDYLKTEYGLAAKVEKIKVSLVENWPNASIQLEGTTVSSTFSAKDLAPMFKAGSISLSFDLRKLLAKQLIVNSVSISDADIVLIKDSTDATNFKILQKSDTAAQTSSSISFDLKKISLRNTRFHYINKERRQNISIQFKQNAIRLARHQEGFKALIKGEILVEELLLNPDTGPFLKNAEARINLSLHVFTKLKSIFADNNSCAVIDGQAYALSAFVELNEKKRFALHVVSDHVDFQKGLRLMSTKIQHSLQQFSIDHPLNVDALVIAVLGVRRDPELLIKISSKKNNLVIGNSKVPYKNVSFSGQIICIADPGQKPDLTKASIIFKSIKGDVYDFPFSASVTIRNLRAPVIDINAALLIEASKVNFKPVKDFILTGNCSAKVKYKGPLYILNKTTFLDEPMQLKTQLTFNQLCYRKNSRSLAYTLNGNAFVANKDLSFENLLLKTDGGLLTLKGIAHGFTPYVFGMSNGFKTTIKASTNLFDLTPLITKAGNASSTPQVSGPEKISNAAQSHFAFSISLLSKKLLARKIVASNVHAELTYDNNLLSVSGLTMNACNGALSAKGSIYNLSDIKARVIIADMDVKLMMEQFENFGQKAIESRNLEGLVSADASLDARLNDRFEIIPESMTGEVEVKLQNGHLLDYEPMQKISTYIFKNRNFKDITFTEIDQTFKIKGYQMQIDHLEIASSVLNLYVNGTYNFKGESNINLRIPWSNLKRRGENYIPKRLGKEGEDAKGLKLNFHGFPNNLKLSLGNK